MNDWEIIEFDARDRIGGIGSPTIRITLANRKEEKEVLVIFQRGSHIVYENKGDKRGRVVQDKEYTFSAGWSSKMKYAMGEGMIKDIGIDFDALLTMANLTLEDSWMTGK